MSNSSSPKLMVPFPPFPFIAESDVCSLPPPPVLATWTTSCTVSPNVTTLAAPFVPPPPQQPLLSWGKNPRYVHEIKKRIFVIICFSFYLLLQVCRCSRAIKGGGNHCLPLADSKQRNRVGSKYPLFSRHSHFLLPAGHPRNAPGKLFFTHPFLGKRGNILSSDALHTWAAAGKPFP